MRAVGSSFPRRRFDCLTRRVDTPIDMRELPLSGAYLLTPALHHDERGHFVRTWSASILTEIGAETVWSYSAYAYNVNKRTLRGMHFQTPPHEEHKLITCVRGVIWDVIADLRRESPTYLRWHAERLDGLSPSTLYVPPGFAHGYLTLGDDTLVNYCISPDYEPSAATGIRWDDPILGIAWPERPEVMSERDRTLPLMVGERKD